MFFITINRTSGFLRKAENMTRARVSHSSLFGSARAWPKEERLGSEKWG